jgi:hypothetical protein
MRTILLLAGVAVSCAIAVADTSDPVSDYKSAKGLSATDVLYRWTADINGDGQPEVFLALKEAYQEDKNDRQMPSWRVYVAAAKGGSYSQIAGVDDGNGVSPILPQIDPERVFVGQVTQLKKPGIVTLQSDIAFSGVGLSRIYAYTIDGDHLKQTLLDQYNPNQSNPIYDQYLSDDKRTHVTLQEVTP